MPHISEILIAKASNNYYFLFGHIFKFQKLRSDQQWSNANDNILVFVAKRQIHVNRHEDGCGFMSNVICQRKAPYAGRKKFATFEIELQFGRNRLNCWAQSQLGKQRKYPTSTSHHSISSPKLNRVTLSILRSLKIHFKSDPYGAGTRWQTIIKTKNNVKPTNNFCFLHSIYICMHMKNIMDRDMPLECV